MVIRARKARILDQRERGENLLRTVADAESKSMVFRQTKVIRLSFIHEREPAGRISVPGVRRYHVECGLQLCFKELF